MKGHFIRSMVYIVSNDNNCEEEHERSGTEHIFKKIKERDIIGKINLSITETQHKVRTRTKPQFD
jgi:hypothetical protein